MSSDGEDIKVITSSFPIDPLDRALLDGYIWDTNAQADFSFAIPNSVDDYEDTREGLIESYPDNNHEGVGAMPDGMVRSILRAVKEFEKALPFTLRYDRSADDEAKLRYAITDFTTDESEGLASYGYSPDTQ
jgi:hypothetical protein